MTLASALVTAPARHVGHMYEDDGWNWVWGSVMMLLLIAVIVAVVWLLVRNTSHGRGTPEPTGSSATEVLAQRYARGEIDTEEYRERLAVLTAGAHTLRKGKARGRGGSDTSGD
ncbi:SHOCT domain-containing protein [Embleya sp. MST-111070]|uniref:SHOCT domain-containing protein n=1 Tax=Embleya sp. MST-111070 TaxID=3398231 RepID=UPI003F736724